MSLRDEIKDKLGDVEEKQDYFKDKRKRTDSLGEQPGVLQEIEW